MLEADAQSEPPDCGTAVQLDAETAKLAADDSYVNVLLRGAVEFAVSQRSAR